jgi:hypothetical protein
VPETLIDILNELHKPVVHVQLLMTVHESIPWVIRNEVDRNRVQRHHIHDILEQPAHLRFSNLAYLERVPMKVHRMLISAAVAKDHTIPFPLSDM